jgi:hypothetical protein
LLTETDKRNQLHEEVATDAQLSEISSLRSLLEGYSPSAHDDAVRASKNCLLHELKQFHFPNKEKEQERIIATKCRDVYAPPLALSLASSTLLRKDQPEVSAKSATEWYVHRAREIVAKSNQVENSLILVKLGIEARNYQCQK